MNEKIEQIKNLIGEYNLERVFEVMTLFGTKFPESFEIYSKDYYTLDSSYSYSNLRKDYYQNYAVVLSDVKQLPKYVKQDMLDDLGSFEFNNNLQKLSFKRNGLFYNWIIYNNGSERLNIRVDNKNNSGMTVVFNRENEGLITSNLWIYAKYRSPVIYSYIYDVVLKDDYHRDTNKKATIDEYHDFFVQLLGDKCFNYAIPDTLKNDEIINIIKQLFKSPIMKLVSELNNTNQIWRFEKERNSILDEYDSEKRTAKNKLDEAIEAANSIYQKDINDAEEKKKKLLEVLDISESEYNASQEKNSKTLK